VKLEGSDKVVAEADVTFAVYDAKQDKAVELTGRLQELLQEMQAETA